MAKERRIVFTAEARLTMARTAKAGQAADVAEPEKVATLTGYAILWNVLSSDRGGYRVRLLPGSAKPAENVHALWHHDYSRPLGDTVSETLRIAFDDIGVKVEIDLPDTTVGNDAEELVETGRVRGMSFAMVNGVEEGEPVREAGTDILNVKLFTFDEVTITAIPAFTQTTVAVSEDDDTEEEPAARVAAARAVESIRFERMRFDVLALP